VGRGHSDDRTPYADVNELLELLSSGIHKILPDKLLGLYLYGSLVTGDFDTQCSDIDSLRHCGLSTLWLVSVRTEAPVTS